MEQLLYIVKVAKEVIDIAKFQTAKTLFCPMDWLIQRSLQKDVITTMRILLSNSPVPRECMTSTTIGHSTIDGIVRS